MEAGPRTPPAKGATRRVALEDELRKLVGERGTVYTEYGGFEIRVSDPGRFPWAEVMRLLTGVGQDIWIKQDKEGRLLIVSKPPST